MAHRGCPTDRVSCSSCRSVDRAEDLAQDALLSALERWPKTGIPDNPGAWLMTTAKHRAVDEARRTTMMDAKHGELEFAAASWMSLDVDSLDEPVADDVLRLMLIACHPVLSKDARVALTLRLIAGLSTAEIARAFLISEVTMAQRIVRAKRTLSEAKVPFEILWAMNYAHASRLLWKSFTSSLMKAMWPPPGTIG